MILLPAAQIKCLAALAMAVAAGAVWMATEGAPANYPSMNAASLALTVAAAWALGRSSKKAGDLVALAAAPLLCALALAFGPAVAGAHRWLAIGDLSVHAAMLAGPAYCVAISRWPDRWQIGAAWALAAVVAAQPDFGTALALACAHGLIASMRREPAAFAAALGPFAALAWTAAHPDLVAPVPFVEGVLAQALADGPVVFAALGAALLAPTLAPRWFAPGPDNGGAALSAWYLGLTTASLIGPYPTPLVGYGAAPIIGYGLACALLGRRDGLSETDR